VRALVIEPASRSLREVEVDGSLESLQAAVQGNIEIIYPVVGDPSWGHNFIYLNDEGRLDPKMAAQRWALKGWGEPYLVGPAIVLADNGEGGSVSPTLSIIDLSARVTFL
jgi:hypothetical protein